MSVGPRLAVAALLGLAASPSAADELRRLGSCGVAAGGFTLPGTDACLRIGGFARAETAWTSASPGLALQVPAAPSRAVVPASSLGRSAIGADARLSVDVRVPTELGPLRAYVSLRGLDGRSTDRAPR